MLNLQALESHLRYFLARLHKQDIAFPKVGDTSVTENYMTNFMSLGDLVDEYNASLSGEEASKFAVDRNAVKVRDAIAHGRLVTDVESFPARLWKFGRAESGHVPIESGELLTDEWLRKTRIMIDAQRGKVSDCLKMRGFGRIK
jgi:hypothetical protein